MLEKECCQQENQLLQDMNKQQEDKKEALEMPDLKKPQLTGRSEWITVPVKNIGMGSQREFSSPKRQSEGENIQILNVKETSESPLKKSARNILQELKGSRDKSPRALTNAQQKKEDKLNDLERMLMNLIEQ